MSLESVTADYLRQLDKVSGLFTMAAAARAGVLNTYYANILALFDATQGGLLYGGAAAGSLALTAGVPIVTAVGVWVALGSGYYQAREEAKKEEAMSGFSQGFVMAILKWDWSHVTARFQRPYLSINKFDEQMNAIRVNSYHGGLMRGFLAGKVLPDDVKIVSKLRSAGKISAPKEWSRDSDVGRNQQISYVIELAASARRNNLIAVD
jgi:hypothetical protein